MNVMPALLLARRGGAVKRYHTVTTLQQETVGHHSHGVALLCYLLSDGTPSKALLMAALVHDLPEAIVGDIPAPIKRSNPEVKIAFEEAELNLLREHDLLFPLSKEEWRTLKLADCLDGMLFCLKERQLGNSTINWIFQNYASYVIELNVQGAGLAIFNFIIGEWRRACE